MKQFKLFFLLFVLMSMIGNKAWADGSCGNGLVWSLSGTDLTITYTGSGTGEMTNYSQDSTGPWGKYITSVVIEDGVTSIGSYAFSGCSGLTSIEIPNSVTSIGSYAFSGCSSLTSIEIPSSVTSIGSSAFSGCSGLTSITVESGNTEYDSRNNCNAIIETSSNTLIAGCKNTVIPNSVTSIGSSAFTRCSGLTSIEIPNSVTSIGYYAFEYCSGLTSIEIPSSVTSIGYSAFSGCSSLTSITVESGNSVYDSRNDCDAIIATSSNKLIFGCKNTVIPITVTSIGEGAFYGCSGLTSIEIPSSVTSIGRSAFEYCSGLTSIVIPNSVTSIGRDAFYATPWYKNKPYGVVYAGKVVYEYKGTMPSNTSVVLEDGTKGIADYAFSGCSGLTSIEIPNGVTSIGEGAFLDCSGLASIEIPSSVTNIGLWAFQGCIGLTSIEIPRSVTTLGNYAFYNCTGLQKVIVDDIAAWCNISFNRSDCNPLYYAHHIYSDEDTEITNLVIPNGVTSIGNFAFYGCSGLTSIEIPNSVTNIGWRAFSGCTGLTSVEIPSSVTYIDVAAFGDCSSLTSIKVELGNTIYDSRNDCNAIIETSSNMLICGCKNTVIPNSVTSIDQSAFYGCTDLTSIKIPKSVTSIGQSAFRDCNSLTSVKVEWETPISIVSNVFTNRANATLYAPTGSKVAYEAADYWKEFKEIVEYDPNVEITMGSSGEATYSSNVDLDFTDVEGLKAYIASGYSPSTGKTTMTRVFKVPAGEGLYLKGEPGSYDIPSVPVDYIYANLLVGVPTATIVNPTEGEYTNFILTYDEVDGIGFYPMDSTGEIGPNKAYLQLPTSALPAASRRIILIFDDEEDVTGISATLNDKSKMINDKAVYDLQGRRVANPTRGLYIVGGKKIMVK